MRIRSALTTVAIFLTLAATSTIDAQALPIHYPSYSVNLKYIHWKKLHPPVVHQPIIEAPAPVQSAPVPTDGYAGLLCIHSHEGAWNANTGNGYYGGLQMDSSFMNAYGPEFVAEYGTANNWPVSDQLIAGLRAVRSRGYSPWPNTAAMCGL